MKLSPQGDKLIEQREGVRLFVYLDSAGKKTAGMGHLLDASTTLKVGDPISQSQCDQWSQIDIRVAEDAVNRLVIVALNQDQFDALCSFVFNVGVEAFAGSTLLKLLNAGDYTGAQAEFTRWHFKTVNGVKLPDKGLLNRRLAPFTRWHFKTVNGVKLPDKGLLNRRLAEAAQFGTVQTPSIAQTPQVSPPDAPEPAPSRPAAPPNKITQTTTGKLQVGALASGGLAAVIQGVNQAMPVLNGIQSANSALSGLPAWLKIACYVLVLGCIGACAATLIHKHRSL